MKEHIYIRVGMIGFDTLAEAYSCKPAWPGCLNKAYRIDPSENDNVKFLFNFAKRTYEWNDDTSLPLILQDYSNNRAGDVIGTSSLERQSDGNYLLITPEPARGINIDQYTPWCLADCRVE